MYTIDNSINEYSKNSSLYSPVCDYLSNKQFSSYESENKIPADSEIIKQFLAYKPLPKDDVIENIFKEKVGLQKASLLQVLSLIKEREKLREQNIAEIQASLINCHSNLYKVHINCPVLGGERRENALESIIADLDEQIRQEKVSCWKDTSRLKQGLLEIAGEYKSASRRASLFY